MSSFFSKLKNIFLNESAEQVTSKAPEKAQRNVQSGRSIQKGSFIKFGKFPQDASGMSPLEWLVLEVSGNEALLVSRYVLDCKAYHHEYSEYFDVTWEHCDLRKWLNSVFLNAVFSERELEKIKVSELRNDANPQFGTSGGNNTRDRVFCLSIAEAERYFGSDAERQGQPTSAVQQFSKIRAGNYGGFWSSVDSNNGCCLWWLRSPGGRRGFAATVNTFGAIGLNGLNVNDFSITVRPALWMKL